MGFQYHGKTVTGQCLIYQMTEVNLLQSQHTVTYLELYCYPKTQNSLFSFSSSNPPVPSSIKGLQDLHHSLKGFYCLDIHVRLSLDSSNVKVPVCSCIASSFCMISGKSKGNNAESTTQHTLLTHRHTPGKQALLKIMVIYLNSQPHFCYYQIQQYNQPENALIQINRWGHFKVSLSCVQL